MAEDALVSLPRGARVRVPFGNRTLIGFLHSVPGTSELPTKKLKPAIEILDSTPLVPNSLVLLAEWASAYYHHPPGEVFSALYPKKLREGKDHEPLGQPGWQLTTKGKGLPPGALKRSQKQAKALALLQANNILAREIFEREGISAAVLRTLREKELVQSCVIPTSASPAICGDKLELGVEQQRVFDSLQELESGFSCHLLEGVTGSGKTEIYLQLIAQCLAAGKQALVLIPEIGLTPQTLRRFEDRFQANIVVMHSGLSEAQRYQSWEAARDGSAHIVIGTRSAVLAPLQNVGLIIVDEEHDSSYKQQDGFRYSARDVAIKRAQLESCPVLLGSATPSLESIHNADLGRYQLHELTTRAGGAEKPAIHLIDLRKQPLQAGLSPLLLEEIEAALARKEQVLLFLNRRGFAPSLQCHDCGWIGECNACDARLTVHRRQRRLRCHHCGRTQFLPQECPRCHSQQLMTQGLGTEQTEVLLRSHFSQAPIFRVDSDSMQGREAMATLVDEINRGEPCILLGTQMLTKGHHFPGVSLVAVIDADSLLFSPDFRGPERMAQLLTQVAGRAGRDAIAGSVYLQSHYPDHPLVQAILCEDYATHARKLLAERLENGLPPGGQLVLVRTDCGDASFAESFLQQLRKKAECNLPSGAVLIGPLPSPMPRRAGKHRCQLMLTAPNRKVAHAAASLLVGTAESMPIRHGLKWTIDIDPLDLI
jgi:primosomal protein N' (replication factor Y)